MALVFRLNSSTGEMLRRLRAGQKWLTAQNRSFLADDPRASRDERFMQAMDSWDRLERVFRCTNYQGCIWGPDGRCPVDSPVVCDGCVREAQAEPVAPASQLELTIGGPSRGH